MSEARISYPFVRDTYWALDEEGGYEAETWKPGVRFECNDPYGEKHFAVADALGECVFTEVSRHKPGKYPERVFYVRQYVTPDGKVFGKTHLRIASALKFARLTSGYGVEFRMAETEKI